MEGQTGNVESFQCSNVLKKTETFCEGVIPSSDAALSGDAALCDEASLNPALYFYQEFTHILQDNKNSFWNRHRSKPI